MSTAGEPDIADSSNVENVDPNKKSFSVEILRLIRDWQQQHGIRFSDYQRYRGYCTRRLGRLRKVLKLPQNEKRHFKKRDVTLAHITGTKADVRYLHVPLLMAERAWAYAMTLRQEANTEPRKRFHLVRKLRKACTYALQLQELCNTDVCDARTKLEADAYSAWMHGTLHFELSLWRKALDNLKKACRIFEKLADALPEEEQVLYRAKVTEMSPNLRCCAHYLEADGDTLTDLNELRAQGGVLFEDDLDLLVAQTKTQSTDALQTMDWRGRKVTVRPDKVRLFLRSVQEVDRRVVKAATIEAKIETLETVIMDCRDAIQAVRDEIQQDPKLRASANNPDEGLATVPGILYLLAYLKYTRLVRTIERNLLLVAQAKQNEKEAAAAAAGSNEVNKAVTKETVTLERAGKKVRPQDFTRLYEIILQNVAELQSVPGMETDAEYQQEADGLTAAFKAFRCYYIAGTLVAMKRWKESVAMYERSVRYAKTVRDDEQLKQRLPFQLAAHMTELVDRIEGSIFTAQAYSVLEQEDQPSEEAGAATAKQQKTSNAKPLFERLNVYKEDPQLNSKNPNVFKLMPDMEPIPCKPLFFDLALNFIEFPCLDDKIDTTSAKGRGTAGAAGGTDSGKGIAGFVKGFLGFGGGEKK